jgi:hypothetical protein
VRRLKQKGVLCGTEYIDKRCDGLTSLTVDDALHRSQKVQVRHNTSSLLVSILGAAHWCNA